MLLVYVIIGCRTVVSETRETEIEVVLDKASFVGFSKKDAALLAGVTMKDGQELSIVVDGDMTLSGKASFGSFHILLKHVSRICFEQK
jgi:hypothetical protein